MSAETLCAKAFDLLYDIHDVSHLHDETRERIRALLRDYQQETGAEFPFLTEREETKAQVRACCLG